MKLLWATDLHLIDTTATDWSPLLCAVDDQVEGLIVTGDIAESEQLLPAITSLADQMAVPIYFVLGNHDFYGSSIGETTRRVIHHVRGDDRLIYLSDSQPIKLALNTYLIGDDGWGDAVEGDYESSYVRLNDFKRIDDFCQLDPAQWKLKLMELGQQCAKRLKSKLDQVPDDADDNWAPFFVCGSIGRVLRNFAKENPAIKLTVICGHTHHDGVAKMSENLTVYTGATTSRKPEIEAELTIGKYGIVVKRFHS
jgi:predicted phosphodiesterase